MADLERVRVWAEALIRMHLDSRVWGFRFDTAKRRAGLCNFTEHRISVSRYLAARWEDDDVYQVLLHEIAHAMAGPEAGHGPKWKRTAEAIGYVGGRTHDGEIAKEMAPWIGTCAAGHEHVRFRRPTRPLSCGSCARGFSEAHRIEWRRRASA